MSADDERDLTDLQTAIRHGNAGVKALEAARRAAGESGAIYPTHLHLAAIELTQAVELALKIALRNG